MADNPVERINDDDIEKMFLEKSDQVMPVEAFLWLRQNGSWKRSWSIKS